MGRISIHGVPGASGASPITGSGTSGQLAFFTGASVLSSSANLTQTSDAAAGSPNLLRIAHNDTGNVASHAYLEAVVGGTGGGDPHVRLTVTGGTSWYMGVDNSNSDVFSIGNGTAVGTNQVLAFTTTTGYTGVPMVQFGNGVASASQVTHSIGITDGIHVFIGGGGTGDASRLAIYGHDHATKADVTEFYSYNTLTGSVSAAGGWTLGESGGSAVHRVHGVLGIGSAAGSTANVLNVRRDQNSATRGLLVNYDTGASAYSRFTVSSDAGDVNLDAYSVAGGAVAGLAVDAAFTGGLDISMGGAREIRLKTNSTTGLSVSGAQLVTIGTGTATIHRLNSQLGTNGAGVATMTNGPAGTSGNPAVWIRINVNGTDRAIPAWSIT